MSWDCVVIDNGTEEYMNGYFQLVNKSDGTYIKLIPPVNGGEKISVNEIGEYLTSQKIFDYDIKLLNNEINRLEAEPKLVKLNEEELLPAGESVLISIEPMKMFATGRFYPPSKGGSTLQYDNIVAALSAKGVRVGIDKAAIEGFFAKRVYCKDIELARGIPVTYGKDASISYNFNTNLNIKPRVNKDGTVDFHHLDNIGHVHKGQVLAELTKEDPGKAGLNVLGEVIKPPTYNKLKLKFGKNITLSEDKLTITSDVDGHASLVEDKVFVSNIYEVEDVDTSTGNIDFEGKVLVKGNVRSGFEIVAKGDIEVHGVVEGATLISGGQIVLERGIQGMNKGFLKAGSNVITKFIESAHVEADGFVQTESILHSTVSAKGEVLVEGKKGFVTGGVVTSLTGVSARTIGSPMGTDTKIEVGIDPAMKENVQNMMNEVEALTKEKNKIDPVISNFSQKLSKGAKFSKEQVEYVQKLSGQNKEITQKVTELKKNIEELNKAFSVAGNARIKVSGRIYTDVKLTVSDCIMYVREVRDHCQFVRDKGEIKVLPL